VTRLRPPLSRSKPKKPLEIIEVICRVRSPGDVLVEITATDSVNTDADTLDGSTAKESSPRSRPWRAPASSASRNVGGAVGEGPGDHVIALYTPECRQCKSCLSQKTISSAAIPRHPGQGAYAGRHLGFSHKGKPVFHYMVCSTFSNFTVLPEIAVCQNPRRTLPFDKSFYIGCGFTTGVGAVVNTAKVTPRQRGRVAGSAAIGLNVIQGARMVGAARSSGVDLIDGKRNGCHGASA